MRIPKRLHFEVQQRNCEISSMANPRLVARPSQIPSYVLLCSSLIEEQGATWCSLFYFDRNRRLGHYIGQLKILSKSSDFYSEMQDGFDSPLDSTFCSMGMEARYYRNLAKLGNIERRAVLCYLRDYLSSYYSQNSFAVPISRSVNKDYSSIKAHKEGEFLFQGKSMADAYSFTYLYHPVYNPEITTKWRVNFIDEDPDFKRCAAIIGENGCGKTNILYSLLSDFISGDTTNFVGHKPLFNSCIALYSTTYDGFKRIGKNVNVPYFPCCLGQEKIMTEQSILSAINKIEKAPSVLGRSMMSMYKRLIDTHLHDYADMIKEDDHHEIRINQEIMREHIEAMSSGQLHMFSLITHLCANIRYSSLIVIDEPEVHLHPQMIMKFMCTLGDFLKEFQSFAIIATHSPLIVREIVNSNVYRIIRLPDDVPTIGTIPYNTFGEDISNLYRQIYNFDEQESYFTKVVEKKYAELKNKKKSSSSSIADEIITWLSQYMTLSMTSKFAIREIIDNCYAKDQTING